MTNDSERFLGSNRLRDAMAILMIAVAVIATMLAISLSEESDAATSGTCGEDLAWELDSKGQLTVSGTGDMNDYSKGKAPWYSVRGSIKTLIVDGAASIGDNAFYGCSKIVGADLGDVSSIGIKSFARCSSLQNVDVGCSLVSIGAYAFFDCDKLRAVSIESSAKSLRTIGSYAFYGCTHLSEMCVPSFVSTIGSKAFSMEFADMFGNPVESTAENLRGYMYGNVNGVLVRQPNAEVGTIFQSEGLTYKVTATMPAEASITGYSGVLKRLTVPETRTVGNYTFDITGIADNAFKECRALRHVDLGSIEKIGTRAFYGCTALGDADLGSTASIGSRAFANCSALRTIDFGDSLKTIGAYAFYNCYALDSISVPGSTETIGSKAFCRCYALESVHLGSSVKSVNSYAFAHCNNIERISFPGSIQYVGTNAFLGLGFVDSEGKDIEPTADVLSHSAFTGSGGVLEQGYIGSYVQFHRQLNPVANPVYETPEPYGETHYATLQAAQESDAGKVIQVLITDPTTGTSATGDFIGAGESATYNGYTYSVNQLPRLVKDGKTYDAVEVVIDGGLNVHEDINDPLVIWYQLGSDPSIPYSVVVKYMCDGAPLLKDGADIRVNSQGEWGETYSYNYLDNPKFDETMAAKYSLLKGYVEQPSNPTNQGETITTTINSNQTVFVFEFSKKGAYVQFHRNFNPVAGPVYESPEPYGDTHYATLSAAQESDAGKVIQVLITDPTTETSVEGKFIGAGESATYNGYTYSVNQLPKLNYGRTYDAVEIVIDGGLNVHDDINDPLVVWYQLV